MGLWRPGFPVLALQSFVIGDPALSGMRNANHSSLACVPKDSTWAGLPTMGTHSSGLKASNQISSSS